MMRNRSNTGWLVWGQGRCGGVRGREFACLCAGVPCRVLHATRDSPLHPLRLPAPTCVSTRRAPSYTPMAPPAPSPVGGTRDRLAAAARATMYWLLAWMMEAPEG